MTDIYPHSTVHLLIAKEGGNVEGTFYNNDKQKRIFVGSTVHRKKARCTRIPCDKSHVGEFMKHLDSEI